MCAVWTSSKKHGNVSPTNPRDVRIKRAFVRPLLAGVSTSKGVPGFFSVFTLDHIYIYVTAGHQTVKSLIALSTTKKHCIHLSGLIKHLAGVLCCHASGIPPVFAGMHPAKCYLDEDTSQHMIKSKN